MAPQRRAWITGYFVPGGVSLPLLTSDSVTPLDARFLSSVVQTTISLQAYTTQHYATAFSDPDKFDPCRWLTTFGGTTEMSEAYMPFSKGSRSCMGINLANMELKLVCAALVYGWDIHVGGITTDDTMSMTDPFVLMPKGGFCDLVFEKFRG